MPEEIHFDEGELWWLIDVAVAVLVNKHEGKRGGGTFNLCSPICDVLFDRRFRYPAPEKADKYDCLADEKTSRLCKHTEHVLSWQSRNEELGHFQGAARAPNGLVGGFSGFLAEEDEALVLWVFVQMGWMNLEEANLAVRISANSRWPDLLQKFDHAAATAD